MRELEISRRAFAAGDAAYFNTPDDEDAIKAAVKAAARLVVATELRWLAQQLREMSSLGSAGSGEFPAGVTEGFKGSADHLVARADELDPPGGSQ